MCVCVWEDLESRASLWYYPKRLRNNIVEKERRDFRRNYKWFVTIFVYAIRYVITVVVIVVQGGNRGRFVW